MLEWDELHSGGDPDAELKPLKPKTGGRGDTVGCVRMCVAMRARALVRERKGVAVSLGDVTNFPESQNNRWLRETLAFCSFLEIRLMLV